MEQMNGMRPTVITMGKKTLQGHKPPQRTYPVQFTYSDSNLLSIYRFVPAQCLDKPVPTASYTQCSRTKQMRVAKVSDLLSDWVSPAEQKFSDWILNG